ncbi:unnamed protein product [Dicrocoelium dendriticum]|nr:unnamed protein product [Dicrocoelium dendriticum]
MLTVCSDQVTCAVTNIYNETSGDTQPHNRVLAAFTCLLVVVPVASVAMAVRRRENAPASRNRVNASNALVDAIVVAASVIELCTFCW